MNFGGRVSLWLDDPHHPPVSVRRLSKKVVERVKQVKVVR